MNKIRTYHIRNVVTLTCPTSISCVNSLPFTNPLTWFHWIVDSKVTSEFLCDCTYCVSHTILLQSMHISGRVTCLLLNKSAT